MKCPKCEEGSLAKIKFKTSGEKGVLCDFCESLWLDNELIISTTGHILRVFRPEKDEFLDKLDREGHSHQSVAPVRHI